MDPVFLIWNDKNRIKLEDYIVKLVDGKACNYTYDGILLHYPSSLKNQKEEGKILLTIRSLLEGSWHISSYPFIREFLENEYIRITKGQAL